MPKRPTRKAATKATGSGPELSVAVAVGGRRAVLTELSVAVALLTMAVTAAFVGSNRVAAASSQAGDAEAFHQAAAAGEQPAVPAALQAQLFAAAAAGNVAGVASALERSGNAVNTVSAEGFSALHFVGQSGHLAAAELLLQKGARTHAVAQGGWTPLLLSAGGGHTALARLLLTHGAAPDAATPAGMTSLHLAAQFGHAATAAALLDGGASATARTAEGATPLHVAAEHGHAEVITAFLSRGARVDPTDPTRGWTPLLLACEYGGHAKIGPAAALALIDGGASVNIARRADGATPLHIAARAFAAPEVAMALIARGADLNAAAHDGSTPLHAAAHGKREGFEPPTCRALAVSHPHPVPAPCPHPVPAPCSHPVPVPCPHPVPAPCFHPVPAPCFHPIPAPCPLWQGGSPARRRSSVRTARASTRQPPNTASLPFILPRRQAT